MQLIIFWLCFIASFHAYVLGANLDLLTTNENVTDPLDGFVEIRKNIAEQCASYRLIFNRIYQQIKQKDSDIEIRMVGHFWLLSPSVRVRKERFQWHLMNVPTLNIW